MLAKGEVEQAFAAFKIVLDGDRDNVPALLGQVCEILYTLYNSCAMCHTGRIDEEFIAVSPQKLFCIHMWTNDTSLIFWKNIHHFKC